MKRHAWIAALALANLRSETARPWNAALLAAFMAANNLLWFGIWVIFFGLAGELRGWTVVDVARLYGIVATAYGLYAAFFGGARNLASLAIDGGPDVYLGRQRATLLGVRFSRCDPTGFGDIVSGIALIAWTGDGPLEMLLALGLSTLGTSILVSVYVTLGSLVFFASARQRFVDQLFDCFLTLSAMPQIGLPPLAKLLLYTAFPAAFVGFVPVEILRSFSGVELGGAVLAAVAFPVLATVVFRCGLKRYASGNLMVDTR